ncbi:MAG: energy transducer TonB [Alphaproteobacteria bacterium]|nr:energy transducer TonB [Alphaproteobacteria bacterium]
MNAAIMAAQTSSPRDNRDSMKSPLVASLVLHAFLIALFSGAFFFFSKPVEIPLEAMAVEILPVAEKAESNIDAPVAREMPKEPKEVSEEPPPMPKSSEKQTPKSEPDKPKETKREKIEEIRPKDAPKPVKKAEVAEKKEAPKPAKAPEKKPAEAKKEEKKEEPKEEDKAEFSSVLKNLVGEDAPPSPDSTPRDTPRQAPQLTAPAPLGSSISMSEMDALRSQLAGCWNVLPGAREADNLAVDIEVVVTAAKTVQDARVVDQLRYNSDTFFRAAADSALRALRSPDCSPLNLPDNKYDQWKNMTIRFDPKDMF